MKVRWDKYPTNIGHLEFNGCFRCHDGEHSTENGEIISNNCNQCHTIIAQGNPENLMVTNVYDSLEFNHPVDIEEAGGEEAMKALVLHDIAEAVDMHESTISRVTTRKYMHTPRGVYEFKHFFSSHVSTDMGGECSATAIRAMIKKLINDEDPAKPLSDNKLTNLLKQRGINVARRTVAKYREALAIPSSHDRKVFA